MRNIIKLLTVIFSALTLSGCISADDIKVNEVKDLSLDGYSALNLLLSVENRSGRNISLTGANLTVNYGGERVGRFVVAPTEQLKRHSVQDVKMYVKMQFDTVTGALRLLNAASSNPDRIFVSGEARIKSGWIKKRVRIDNVAVSDFIANFDAYL